MAKIVTFFLRPTCVVWLTLTILLNIENASSDDSLHIQDDDLMHERRRAMDLQGEEFEGDPSAMRREAHPGMQMGGGHPGMQMGGHPGMQMGGHPGMQMGPGGKRMGKMGKQRMGKQGMQMGGQPGMAEEYDENGNPIQKPVDTVFITTYEICFISFVILFFINMFIGKSRNYKFAKNWYFTNKEFLFNNYAHVGVIIDRKKDAIALMKDSYNSYKIYASGRVNSKWIMCSLEVNIHLNQYKRRQDLLFTILGVIFRDEDKINFEVSLECDIPTVMAFCRKRDVSMLKKNYSDIDFFCKEFQPKYINSQSHCLLAENKDVFEEVVESKNVSSSFKKIESHIICIYMTERKLVSKEDNILYFSFKNQIGNQELYKDIITFVHLFYDQICTYRMPQNFRKEAEVRRAEFERLKMKEQLKVNIKNPDHKINTKKKGK